MWGLSFSSVRTVRTTCCALTIACAISLCARPGRADDATIRAAEASYGRGALREAERLFTAALAEPGHDHDELVRIHVHLGILAAARGAERTARAHFEIALALEPRLPAPPELAGRDRSRFEQERPREGLALDAVLTPTADGADVDATLSHAPLGLVARLELRCAGTTQMAPAGRDGHARLRIDRDALAQCERPVVVALDARGGALLEVTAHAAGAP